MMLSELVQFSIVIMSDEYLKRNGFEVECMVCVVEQ